MILTTKQRTDTVVRWLHLTDLHFGSARHATHWNQIKESFLLDLKKLVVERQLCIDLVIVSGDFVDRGQWVTASDGLVKFFRQLRDLLKNCGCEPYFFAVPGNHDVAQTQLSGANRAAINAWNSDHDVRNDFWSAEPQCPIRPLVEKGFEEYRSAITGLSEKDIVRFLETEHPGTLPGDATATFEKSGKRIGLLGLNSTFLQLDKRITTVDLDIRQASAATPDGDFPEWRSSHDACLLITHHPPKLFAQPEHFNSYIFDPLKFAVLLCGDLHIPDHVATAYQANAPRRIWQGGALGGVAEGSGEHQSDWSHGYSIGEICLVDNAFHVRRWPRIATDRTKWKFDRDVYSGASEDHDGATPWEPPLLRSEYLDPQARSPAAGTSPVRSDEQPSVKTVDSNETGENAEFFSADSSDSRDPDDLSSGFPDNPYKGLKYLEMGDRIYGRDLECDDAMDALVQGFEREGVLPVVQLRGASGSGKSSLLRAGVFTALNSDVHQGRYLTSIIRITHTTGEEIDPTFVLREILLGIEQDTGLALTLAEFNEIENAGAAMGRAAAKALVRQLTKSDADNNRRLVLGVDQFEEILDDLSRHIGHADPMPIIDFLNSAVEFGSVAVVYTLESSRIKALEDLHLGGIFRPEAAIEIAVDRTDTFIREVITKPFSDAGYTLARDVVNTLIANIREIGDGLSLEASGDLLPLISLCLETLFEHVRTVREPDFHRSAAASIAWDDNDRGIDLVTVDDVGDRLDLKSVIAERALLAWQRATNTHNVDLEELNKFLQPFVSVTGLGFDQVELHSVPESKYGPDRRLMKEFRQCRLMTKSDGKYRIVHEAVLRHWPAATEWFDKVKDYLDLERRMRVRASEWERDARPEPSPDVPQERIDEAAEVLAANFRTWVAPRSRAIHGGYLCEYCLAVLRRSVIPDRALRDQFGKYSKATHISLAASYGLNDLLEKFHEDAPGCLVKKYGNDEHTLLHKAAWSHATTVRLLLERGVDPTITDRNGWMPIAAAVFGDNLDTFSLLKHFCEPGVHAKKDTEMTLLHLVAQNGRLAMIELLLTDQTIGVKEKDKLGRQAIHFAALGGSKDAFRLLMTHNEITATTDSAQNCLYIAAAGGHNGIVRILLQEPTFRAAITAATKKGLTALWAAAYNKNLATVRLLLVHIDPARALVPKEKDAGHALHAALLVPNGFVPDEEAILPIVKELLCDPRTDVNAAWDNRSPLELAEKLPRVQALLLAHPKIHPLTAATKDGPAPILLAARAGQWPVVARMLDRCASELTEQKQPPLADLRDRDDNTLLHLATRPTARAVVDRVLDLTGPEGFSSSNKKGRTPAFSAIAAGTPEALRLIVEKYGPAALRRPTYAATAAEMAIGSSKRREFLEIIAAQDPALLVDRNELDWTALHTACALQQDGWIDLLREFIGDDDDAWLQTDSRGRRPAHLLRPEARASMPGPKASPDWPPARYWSTDLTWIAFDGDERTELIGRMEPIDGKYEIGSDTTLERTTLSFYADPVSLIRIRDQGWARSGLTVYYFNSDEILLRLDGTSPHIHEVNARFRIKLSVDNVLDYLRFFCFFVRSTDGPFYVYESYSHEGVPEIEDDEKRRTAHSLARPSWLCGTGSDGSVFHCSIAVWYGDAIFGAIMRVHRNGQVKMLYDIPLVKDLDSRIEAPLS